MRILSVEIRNFRSMLENTIPLESVTTFIGPNNAGKSTVLRAIEHIVSPSLKFEPLDWCNYGSDEREIVLEAVLGNLTSKELDLFSNHVGLGGVVTLRKTGPLDEQNIPATNFFIGIPQWSQDLVFLSSDYHRSIDTPEKVVAASKDTNCPDFRSFLLRHSTDGVTAEDHKEFRIQYLLSHGEPIGVEMQWMALSPRSELARSLPDTQFVPAVLTLEEDLNMKQGTLMTRLVMLMVSEIESQVREVQETVKTSFESLLIGEAACVVKKFETVLADELEDWQVEPRFLVDPPDISKLVEKAFSISLTDSSGSVTTPTSSGHGLQRAAFLALVRALGKFSRIGDRGAAEAGAELGSMVLFVEEPELYLHPQAQIRLYRSLRAIGASTGCQIVMCSHSSTFVDLSQHLEIRRVTRGPEGHPLVADCESLELLEVEDKDRSTILYSMNSHRAELFFAERVILVEGQTEATLLPEIARRRSISMDGWSVVDCGSKHNLPRYIQLLNAFQIPYVVVHDEDPPGENPGQGADVNARNRYKSKLDTYNLNETIESLINDDIGDCVVLCPEFEGEFDVSKRNGVSRGKALAALDRLNRYDDEGVSFPDSFETALTEIYAGRFKVDTTKPSIIEESA